ncbi:MAG: AmmeMemoRadiSam system radical SAM enzyme [Desulfobacterota bacterium]|nr:AmmeMemoRadiSam system radical SAM enzyme [Thermodesulfobacteriota bacterium]MDW8002006.1 AmmeMemoRadiSam system radical SAM enzyme [Deltaproteobacteria bacterium]
MREASYYEALNGQRVKCRLCRHNCVISEGKRGICGVRENRGGILFSLVYNRLCSYHVDPIEKKPLFHFFPGSSAFSIATVGCNFRCLHCQNYEISQLPKGGRILGYELTPAEIVEMALRYNCKSISYTYTEPTVFFEYAFDVARIAKEKGLFNNFVTNGYIEEKPLKDISGFLDGANIDLKSFSKEFYKKICGADFESVLESIKLYKRLGIWVEITTLIIPGLNDSHEELREIARFIKNELGRETPWHVTAFYPTYKLTDRPRTDRRLLKEARTIGLEEGLFYVYEGNVPGSEGENTFCYNCGKLLVERFGFSIVSYRIRDGSCQFCGAKIHGVGL